MDKLNFSNLNVNEINAILNKLTPEEKELALSVLNEYANEGHSNTLDAIILEDYAEIPVDIETFVDSNDYLGYAWHDAEGKSKLYPYWRKELKKLFPDNITTSVNNTILSGSRGRGKSEIACLILAYLLHRVLCLKNPVAYFNLKPTEKIVFAFMNIKLELAEEIALSKFQNTIQSSPWFMNHGYLEGRSKKIWYPQKYKGQIAIDIKIGSQSDDLIGLPIYACFFDEISFIKNKDVEKQKEKANDMIDTAIGGMKTRFVHKGKNPTMLILASSKRSDKSFLEEHMKKKLKSEKTNVYISDGSVWEVKPKGTYKDETFAVAVGNKFLTSIILPEGADEKEYRLKGYVKIIHPPVDFKADFIDDIDRALCDFAGISSSSLTKYISGQAVSEVINTTLQNAFTSEILTIGTGPEDREVQYYHFFDKSRIPRELLSKPLFIHLDMSLTGDKTGIAGVFIKGKKTSADPSLQDRDLFYTLGFAVSIKAPKGRQISFEKNRNFIRWLKDQGFIIKGISCFKGNTLIKTEKGLVPIKDIKVGDKVYSFNIATNKVELKTVQNSINNGPRNTFIKIYIDESTFIECTPKHPILTINGYKKACEISDLDSLIIDDSTYYKYKLLNTGLFEDNQYLNEYINLIVKYKNKSIDKELYYEKHHIIPRCIFRYKHIEIDNSEVNLVDLPFSYHILAHIYLYKACKDEIRYKLGTVFTKMIGNKYNLSQEEYIELLNNSILEKELTEIKKEVSIIRSNRMKGNTIKLGKPTSNETKLKLSESNKKSHNCHPKSEFKKGHIPWNKGLVYNLNEEERKLKFSKKKKGHWYTNGIDNLYVSDGEYIPENYYPGRVISQSTKDKIRNSVKEFVENNKDKYKRDIKYKWITNGNKNKRIPIEASIPEGYYLGRTISESHLLAIKQSNSGKDINRVGFKGKHHTEDTKRKISDSLKRRGAKDDM